MSIRLDVKIDTKQKIQPSLHGEIAKRTLDQVIHVIWLTHARRVKLVKMYQKKLIEYWQYFQEKYGQGKIRET